MDLFTEFNKFFKDKDVKKWSSAFGYYRNSFCLGELQTTRCRTLEKYQGVKNFTLVTIWIKVNPREVTTQGQIEPTKGQTLENGNF